MVPKKTIENKTNYSFLLHLIFSRCGKSTNRKICKAQTSIGIWEIMTNFAQLLHAEFVYNCKVSALIVIEKTTHKESI
jgi:hypothetical protein